VIARDSIKEGSAMLARRIIWQYPFNSGECQSTILITFSGICLCRKTSAPAERNYIAGKQTPDAAEVNQMAIKQTSDTAEVNSAIADVNYMR
jgi:hypothetical protein